MELRFKTIEYHCENHEIVILDQTKLPEEEVYLRLRSVQDVYEAIRNMKLRGAPLIGVAGAYGVVLAGVSGNPDEVREAADYLKSARPTAVNLSWAIGRMKQAIKNNEGLFEQLLKEAQAIEQEDKEACQRMGEFGAELIREDARVMVHCNAGALATSGIGTALGVLYTAKDFGREFVVYSCETRPLLQGARLTSWELTANSIKTYTICDNMAATYMPEMDLVLVGADRIARNGDTANKIGTKGLAIIARYYNIPFYVAAPVSSFDLNIASKDGIPIEERGEDEIRRFNGKTIVATDAKILNPAFDVTPATLISGIITEKGILRPPYQENICRMIGKK